MNYTRTCGTGCDLSRIDLKITYQDRKYMYNITNTGSTSICGKVMIHSKLFDKLCFDEIILPVRGDTVSLTEARVGYLEQEEEARAYVKLGDTWIYSKKDTIRTESELPILNSYCLPHNAVYPTSTDVIGVTNHSSYKAKNVKLNIKFSRGVLITRIYYLYDLSGGTGPRIPYTDYELVGDTLVINLGDIEPWDCKLLVTEMVAVPDETQMVLYFSTADDYNRELSKSQGNII